MPLTKIEHYLVLTDDIDATRDFYIEALGMQAGFRPPLGFPGHWVYIGDTPVIHIAFAAQDYDEVLARLQRLGVAVRINDNPGNIVRQLFLFDPNGVKIEINFRK